VWFAVLAGCKQQKLAFVDALRRLQWAITCFVCHRFMLQGAITCAGLLSLQLARGEDLRSSPPLQLAGSKNPLSLPPRATLPEKILMAEWDVVSAGRLSP
jgi:hypothetical protein